jgi:hypothetical protein
VRYEVIENTGILGRWAVIADDQTGSYVTFFEGSNAEMRAREYATWKNVFSGGSKGGINGGAFRQ